MQAEVPSQPEFGGLVQNSHRARGWLQKEGLLLLELRCGKDVCGGCSMKERIKAALSDKVVWECPKCGSQRTVRSQSVFYSSRLHLPILCYLLYYFCKDVPAYIASRLLGGSVSYKSIIAWYYRLREVCSNRLKADPLIFDGDDVALVSGESAVELDESLFGKKGKGGRGMRRQKFSVFGIVERRGRRCIFYIVKDRKASTLVPHIVRHVKTNCTIMHDGFASYSSLEKQGYVHHMVNHSVEFVTSEGYHTNTIEGLWGLLKQRISRMHGLPSYRSLAALLDEFAYRQRFSDSGCIWVSLVNDLRVH